MGTVEWEEITPATRAGFESPFDMDRWFYGRGRDGIFGGFKLQGLENGDTFTHVYETGYARNFMHAIVPSFTPTDNWRVNQSTFVYLSQIDIFRSWEYAKKVWRGSYKSPTVFNLDEIKELVALAGWQIHESPEWDRRVRNSERAHRDRPLLPGTMIDPEAGYRMMILETDTEIAALRLDKHFSSAAVVMSTNGDPLHSEAAFRQWCSIRDSFTGEGGNIMVEALSGVLSDRFGENEWNALLFESQIMT